MEKLVIMRRKVFCKKKEKSTIKVIDQVTNFFFSDSTRDTSLANQNTSESVFRCNRVCFQPITRIFDYPLHAIRKVRTSIFIVGRIWKWKLDFLQKPLSCCFCDRRTLAWYDGGRMCRIKFQKNIYKLLFYELFLQSD